MHIALIAPHHISKYTGGQERYAHELALGLHQKGHQVSYICSAADKQSAPYSIYPLRAYSLINYLLPTRSWLDKITQLDPDIVHITVHTLPYIVFGRLIKTKHRSKVIIMYLAPSTPKNYILQMIHYFSEKFLFKNADAITTLSSNHTRLLRSRHPNLYVDTLTPSLPSEYYTLASKPIQTLLKRNDTNLLFVSTLDHHHYYKGLDTLLQAMKILDASYHLHIVGGGNIDHDLKHTVSQLKLKEKITLHGHLSTHRLKQLYHHVDVVVLPSSAISEGFGIVLLESLSQGTPVITTSVSGASSLLLNQPFAQVILPNESQELVKAIKNIPQKNKIDNHAISFSRNFTQQKLANNAETIYKKSLDDGTK